MPSLTSQYAVIGAGLAGSATAWQLAARGHEVTLLEQTTPAHRGGSSHGSARILRYAYAERLYARLMVRAKPLWDELERSAGRTLVTPTGAVDFGARRQPETLAQVLGDLGVDHELLSVQQATERWPEFRFDTPVLWHPGAGVIHAQAAVEAMVELAVAHGAHLETGWQLASAAREGAGYRLVSSRGDVVEAERVVVCAGGWLPDLLADLALPRGFLSRMPELVVRQEQAYHFPYRDGSGSSWPTFISMTDRIVVYGLPGGEDAGFRGQKVAEFNGGKPLPSAAHQDQLVDPDNRRRVTSYVQEHLPGLEPEPYAETTCLFTNTPDENFVLDRADGITVVSPCSGHGAKFAPLIGAMAADVASAADTSDVPAEFRVAAEPS
ncbi:FAD-dependent oxidoreductase [Saccharopolyspora oryzae]|uniref:FAD-dependent oxidoreductase n=1 Tax=Saccharopolyspora oryzae TaxID=2997343 RepID=A0ABT4V667_9PSEU|nr:FAD-dependent oxidoreductase [Saccharopolyspora oryzae]MDA3629328.1 FAD-dependent oxidoreductase [Saccharopolyspora oryzae]